MRDVQRVAIVDPSDATREQLRNLLLGIESVWLEAECSRYEFFFDVIQPVQPGRGRSSPSTPTTTRPCS